MPADATWQLDGLPCISTGLRSTQHHLIRMQNTRRHALVSCTPGKGNHSVGGRPRIRPAVVRWLTEAGHRFAATADTGGIIVQVTLRDHQAQCQSHLLTLCDGADCSGA